MRFLVERFAPAARDLAAAILNDRHLAEDAVQAAELFYFEDFSLARIARQLGVPQGTVKRRLHDVRAQLRNLLLGYMVEPEPPEPPPQRPDPFNLL